MPKLETAFAAAVSVLLLSACGSAAPGAAENRAVEADSNAADNAGTADPVQPGAPVNAADETVPPPDAVSHPDGYLPPAPAEPATGNSSGPEATPPATEDEYTRNRQSGR